MAKLMIPPKPLLTWDEVTDLEFLSHIETLRGRDDIRTKEWTKQPFRDATRAWTKLQRAREELDIIAIEACRLAASIGNEEAELAETISQTKLSNPELAQYIVIAFRHRTNAHAHLRTKLARLKTRLPSNGLFQGQSTSSPSSPVSNQSGLNTVRSTIHHTQPPHLAQSTLSGTAGATEESEDEQQEDDMQERSHEVIDKLVDTLDVA